jgi:hypothetical protein
MKQRLKGRERAIATMGALQDLDMGDAQLAALMQKMEQDQRFEPAQLAALESEAAFNKARAKSASTEADLAPEMLKSQTMMNQLRGIGDIGQGMMMSNPELSEDVMTQLLQRFGLYQNNPMAALERQAAQHGMTVEQFQMMRERLLNNKTK